MVLTGNTLYLAGWFYDNFQLGSTTLTGAGANNQDIFVAKLVDTGTSGSFSWVQQAGGAANDLVGGLVVSGGQPYVTGIVGPPASFGPVTLTAPTATVNFIASLSEQALSPNPRHQLPEISVFPNPAHATVTVDLPATTGTPQALLTLLDVTGRTVQTRTAAVPASGLRCELDLTGLAAGVYALRVQLGDTHTMRQVVVK